MMCLLAGPNDGTVALKETKLGHEFPADFVVVHLPHTTIATSPQVAPLVTQFLKHGRFSSAPDHEQIPL